MEERGRGGGWGAKRRDGLSDQRERRKPEEIIETDLINLIFHKETWILDVPGGMATRREIRFLKHLGIVNGFNSQWTLTKLRSVKLLRLQFTLHRSIL